MKGPTGHLALAAKKPFVQEGFGVLEQGVGFRATLSGDQYWSQRMGSYRGCYRTGGCAEAGSGMIGVYGLGIRA